MGQIRILPDVVINKIAAGEVIERSASVVKELIENALDASAERIEIELEDGGRKLIRITDDGQGMDADDLRLALERHATSKLRESADLFFVTTMGFRGEALPSIGSVSKMRLLSHRRGEPAGHETEMSGGAIGEVKPCAAPEGTCVEVRNLFFNTPARRKFLKSSSTEMAHVTDRVTRFALAHPRVHFVLRHNRREQINVAAADDRRERLALLLGRELGQAMLPIDYQDGVVQVSGFAAPPEHTRPNTKLQFLFLNGRAIRNPVISHALRETYADVLPSGRCPVVVIFLQIDPRQVDVNVHPCKSEVRFANSRQIHQAVATAVRQALFAANLAPLLATPSASRAAPSKPEPQPATLPFQGTSARPAVATERPTPAPPVSEAALPCNRFMQFHDAYILEETADGIAIIDQHALHERILYCEILARIRRRPLESQRLLLPEVVELSRLETDMLVALSEELKQLGVEATRYADDSVAVHSLPVLVGGCRPATLLHEMLNDMASSHGGVQGRTEQLVRTIACKAAVKAGEKLSAEEIASLLCRRDEIGEAATCPHGRPTTLFFPRSELDQQFHRS